MKWCSHETYIRLCVVYFIVMLLLLLPLPRCVLFFSFSFSRSSSSLFHLITVFRLPYWFVGNACVSKLLLLGNCSHGTMFMHWQWCASPFLSVCVCVYPSIYTCAWIWLNYIDSMYASKVFQLPLLNSMDICARVFVARIHTSMFTHWFHSYQLNNVYYLFFLLSYFIHHSLTFKSIFRFVFSFTFIAIQTAYVYCL